MFRELRKVYGKGLYKTIKYSALNMKTLKNAMNEENKESKFMKTLEGVIEEEYKVAKEDQSKFASMCKTCFSYDYF
jgi:hypothetical protein